jgi:hypothetical protein
MVTDITVFAQKNPAFQFLGEKWLLIIALAFAGVIVLTLLFNLVWKKLHLDDTRERDKKRSTTGGDLKKAAETFGLDSAEQAILAELCHRFKPANVNHLFLNAPDTDALFKKAFPFFADGDARLTTFFSLLEKICRVRLMARGLRTTASLPVNQQVFVLDPKGPRWSTTLVERDKDTMTLTAPRNEAGEVVQYKELSRVTILVENLGDAALTAALRVLRYQTRQDREELVLAQTPDVQTFIKQDYLYVACKKKCTYARCREKVTEHPDGSVSTDFPPEEEFHEGVFLNYTAKTCNFLAKSDMDLNIFVTVQVDIEERVTGDHLVLQTVRKAKHADGWLVHGRLVYAQERLKNYMLARIYGYERRRH